MKAIVTSVSLITLLAFTSHNQLTGTWETKPSVKGNVTRVVFHEDDTYEGFINKKPFVSGTYRLRGDTITLEEPGCNGYKATYKLIFFSGSDSLRFEHINDSCMERRQGMQRTILGRIK